MELGVADPREEEWRDDLAQRVLLRQGDFFFVPPGYIYRLENHSAVSGMLLTCYTHSLAHNCLLVMYLLLFLHNYRVSIIRPSPACCTGLSSSLWRTPTTTATAPPWQRPRGQALLPAVAVRGVCLWGAAREKAVMAQDW